MANAFDLLNDTEAGLNNVKKVSTCSAVGTWTITGLEIGKPLYILSTVDDNSSGRCCAYLDAISGTNDAKSGTTTNDQFSYRVGYGNDTSAPNCLVVVPTSSTVVFDVKIIYGKVTLNAYQ